MSLPVIPLVVATALFMENMDATALATALPTLARALGIDPVEMKLALTCYTLAVAVTVPASGWVADRWGARRVFVAALLTFTAASALCGTAQTLGELVVWRTLQGVGGAMMTPVGRLIILRATPREGLVGALAWFTVPALIGPLVGPPLAGLVVTVADWRWVFFLNVPVGLLGALLALRLLPKIAPQTGVPFDTRGFLLAGAGFAGIVAGATLVGVGQISPWIAAALGGAGVALLALYVRHAKRTAHPLLDLDLMRLTTFRVNITGGSAFRIGVAATPFLLPLLFQLGFGWDPLTSGLMTLAIGLGALLMKLAAQPVLARFGFRNSLLVNAVLSAVFLALPAAFSATTPYALVLAGLFVAGFLRSLQFTAMNALSYAEVDKAGLGKATSFNAVAQQVASSLGIALAALLLEASRAWRGADLLAVADFQLAFIVVGLVAAASMLSFLGLSRDAGRDLAQRDPG